MAGRKRKRTIAAIEEKLKDVEDVREVACVEGVKEEQLPCRSRELDGVTVLLPVDKEQARKVAQWEAARLGGVLEKWLKTAGGMVESLAASDLKDYSVALKNKQAMSWAAWDDKDLGGAGDSGKQKSVGELQEQAMEAVLAFHRKLSDQKETGKAAGGNDGWGGNRSGVIEVRGDPKAVRELKQGLR